MAVPPAALRLQLRAWTTKQTRTLEALQRALDIVYRDVPGGRRIDDIVEALLLRVVNSHEVRVGERLSALEGALGRLLDDLDALRSAAAEGRSPAMREADLHILADALGEMMKFEDEVRLRLDSNAPDIPDSLRDVLAAGPPAPAAAAATPPPAAATRPAPSPGPGTADVPPPARPAPQSPAAAEAVRRAQERVAELRRQRDAAEAALTTDPHKAQLEAAIAARRRAIRGQLQGRRPPAEVERLRTREEKDRKWEEILENAYDEDADLKRLTDQLEALGEESQRLRDEIRAAELDVQRARIRLSGSQVLDRLDLPTIEAITPDEIAALSSLTPADWQALHQRATGSDEASGIKGRLGELLFRRSPQLAGSGGGLAPLVDEARARAAATFGIDPAAVHVVTARTPTHFEATGLPTGGTGELGDVVIGAVHRGRFRVLTLVEVKAGPGAVTDLWSTPGAVGQIWRDIERIGELPLTVTREAAVPPQPPTRVHPGVGGPSSIRIVIVTTPEDSARALAHVRQEFPLAEGFALPVHNDILDEVVRLLIANANPSPPPP
jgi:hypothetical protein